MVRGFPIPYFTRPRFPSPLHRGRSVGGRRCRAAAKIATASFFQLHLSPKKYLPPRLLRRRRCRRRRYRRRRRRRCRRRCRRRRVVVIDVVIVIPVVAVVVIDVVMETRR